MGFTYPSCLPSTKLAPNWWLTECSRVHIVRYMTIISILWVIHSITYFLDDQTEVAFALDATALVTLLASLYLRLCPSDARFQLVFLATVFFQNSCLMYTIPFRTSETSRKSHAAYYMFMCKMACVWSNLSLVPTITYLVVSFCIDITGRLSMLLNHGDSMSEHSVVEMFLISTAFIVMAVGQHTRMCQLYDAQTQLSSEKEAFESLLSVVSDAAIWLGCDGDVVLRSDSRFDEVMGRAMTGKMLSQCYPEQVPEVEKRKIQDCCIGTDGTCKRPVSLLPTTLYCHPNISINVDLFIVDRRFAVSNTGSEESDEKNLGFLVGLRMASQGDPFAARHAPDVPHPSKLGTTSAGEARELGTSSGGPLSAISDLSSVVSSVPSTLSQYAISSKPAMDFGNFHLLFANVEVLVQGFVQLVPRRASTLQAGDRIYCIDSTSCEPRLGVVTGIREAPPARCKTFDLHCKGSGARSALRVLEPWHLLLNRGDISVWRPVANGLFISDDITVPSMEDVTANLGHGPRSFHVTSESEFQSDQATGMLCIQFLEQNLALCVRDPVEGNGSDTGPYFAFAMQQLLEDAKQSSSQGSTGLLDNTSGTATL